MLPDAMITLGIAILLAAGLTASKICQRVGLPSVTGYIFAGLLLGPTGIGLITQSGIGDSLDHFTQIALMLIAFGIGEHIELKSLKSHTSSLKWISICEAGAAFCLVGSTIYLTMAISGFTVEGWQARDYIVLSLLLGSVGVATAPAATLLVIRELKAKGPLTSTLMAIVAIDDGLAIIIFGFFVSVAHQVLGQTGAPFYTSVTASVMEIVGSLLLGVLTGAILVLVLKKLEEPGELITAGLAILLLCGETALKLHLSPLLAGMSAGLYLVNKVERDVRVFRALNRFEPPIYVLFFTLAGSHLDIDSLRTAGILGVMYFLSTIFGKLGGVYCGARIARSPTAIRNYLGFAMFPQAGVAIGLIFLLSSDPILSGYMEVITPVVLTGVFLSELIGPVCARFAITRAGEAGTTVTASHHHQDSAEICSLDKTFRIIPWQLPPLSPPQKPHGHVVFHAAEPAAARGLARIATILAYHYRALPMAVDIDSNQDAGKGALFHDAQAEVDSMGYSLATELVPGPDIAAGIIAAAEYNETKALVLAYPFKGDKTEFQEYLDRVSHYVHCPVMVVRFFGELHTQRILIPLSSLEDLRDLYDVIVALERIGGHHLNLLYMVSSMADPQEIIARELEIEEWLEQQHDILNVTIMAVPTDSRVDVINKAANDADIVVMAAGVTSGVERILFGSLMNSVEAKLQKTLIVVYNTGKHTQQT